MSIRRALTGGLSLVRAGVFGRRTPLSVHLSLTNRCTGQCPYCTIRRRPPHDLDTRQAMVLIDQMTAAGTRRIHLVGGEPTLHPDVGRLALRARQRNLFVSMATTGLRVAERIDELDPVDLVILSFEGPREVHDSLKGAGTFDALSSALEALSARGKRVWTTTILNRMTVGHIPYVLDTARRRGFTAGFTLMYYSTGVYRGHPNSFGTILPDRLKKLVLSDAECRRVIRRLLDLKATAPIGSSRRYLNHLLRWPDYRCNYAEAAQEGIRCAAGRCYCYVDDDGRMYPCNTSVGRMPGRDTVSLGFARAFASLPPGPCRDCVIACNVEANLLASLSPSVVLNWVRATRRTRNGARPAVEGRTAG